jgi:hypothetical protein
VFLNGARVRPLGVEQSGVEIPGILPQVLWISVNKGLVFLRLGSLALFPTNVRMLGDAMYAEMMSAFGGGAWGLHNRRIVLPRGCR